MGGPMFRLIVLLLAFISVLAVAYNLEAVTGCLIGEFLVGCGRFLGGN